MTSSTTTKWSSWFRVDGVDLRWLRQSPSARTSRCDRRWSHVVAADRPRLQADTGAGPVRKRGKGKAHEYLCAACALEVYGVKPPSIMAEDQEKLF